MSINLLLLSSLVFGLALIGFGICMLTQHSAPRSVNTALQVNHWQQ